MEKLSLTLGHLYPNLLDIHGDYGNILTLKKRCEWRNIDLIVNEINLEDNLEKQDIYFIGSGQNLQHITLVANELQKYKDFLHTEMNNNAVFLGICGGFQILGNYIQTEEKKIDGVGLLNSYTVITQDRFVGNVTAKLPDEYNLSKNTLVGFENHSGKTYMNGETKPLSEIIIGNGNNKEDKGEGARFKNVFGTYLHGPFLPKNPHFADYLIKLALEKKYGKTIELAELDDEIEYSAHESVLNKTY